MATKTFKRGKKMNSEILSVRELHTVQGCMGERRFLTNAQGEVLKSKSYGNDLEVFELADPNTAEVKTLWLDGGLRGAMSLAKVKPGDMIEIEATGETRKIDEGTVHVYNIYKLEQA